MCKPIVVEANMYAMNLLEEAGAGSGSIWIPIIGLGWFLIMTLVGWSVSRRANAAPGPQEEHNSPAEHDHH